MHLNGAPQVRPRWGLGRVKRRPAEASLCLDKSQAAKKWQLAVAIVPPKLAAPTRPLHRHGRDMASPSAATAYSARAAGGSLASLAPRRAARPPLHARALGHAHARLGSRVLGHGVRMAIADTKLRQGMVCDVGTWRTGDQASTADVTCCTTDTLRVRAPRAPARGRFAFRAAALCGSAADATDIRVLARRRWRCTRESDMSTADATCCSAVALRRATSTEAPAPACVQDIRPWAAR